MAGILRVRDKDGVIREIPAFQSGVPFTRTVNGYPLSADVALSAADVGASPANHKHSAADVGASPANHKHSAADVGAVSAGFGNYGETISSMGSFADESELETALTTLVSQMENNEVRRVRFLISSIGDWSWMGTLFKSSDNYATLEVVSGVGSHVSKITKTLSAGVWTPLEWENPPMRAGEEYRTTERWNQKAVCTAIVDCGSASDGKTVYFQDITATAFVRYCGFTLYNGNTTVIPAIELNGSSWDEYNTCAVLFVGHGTVKDTNKICLRIRMEGSLFADSDVNVKVQVWYTKD